MKLKLIIFIVDIKNINIVSGVLGKENVRFHWTNIGHGTANSEMLDILGIGSSEKAIILCIEQAIGVPTLIKEVRKKLIRKGPGTGIAFSIPLSAINDPLLLFFKESILKNVKISNQLSSNNKSKEGDTMKITHDLIVCVVNHGNSDEVMTTARSAGATGGTVLNARGTAHEGPVKFFGVSVQNEKEVILILSDINKKNAIMQAICETHGLNKDAQGLVFSLPVDNVMGLSVE